MSKRTSRKATKEWGAVPDCQLPKGIPLVPNRWRVLWEIKGGPLCPGEQPELQVGPAARLGVRRAHQASNYELRGELTEVRCATPFLVNRPD